VSAAALKERLRADLKAAMLARPDDEARLLRSLVAALDHTEAMPALARIIICLSAKSP